MMQGLAQAGVTLNQAAGYVRQESEDDRRRREEDERRRVAEQMRTRCLEIAHGNIEDARKMFEFIKNG